VGSLINGSNIWNSFLGGDGRLPTCPGEDRRPRAGALPFNRRGGLQSHHRSEETGIDATSFSLELYEPSPGPLGNSGNQGMGGGEKRQAYFGTLLGLRLSKRGGWKNSLTVKLIRKKRGRYSCSAEAARIGALL